MPPIQFIVDRRDAGQTLAAVLKTRFGISWSQAKRLVEKRHVKVSGQVETDVARRLKLGKRVELAAGTVELTREAKEALKEKGRRGEGVKGRKGEKAKPSAPAQPRREPKPKEATRRQVTPSPAHPFTPSLPPEAVVYSDDAVVVVNKPAGLTTMRYADETAEFGRGKRFLPRTLSDLLPALIGAPNRPVVAVHRIDRDTSGLVVFARTREAAESLMRQFRKHSTDRRYLALTRGTPLAGRVESVFVRDRGDGRRGSTTGRQGEPPAGSPSNPLLDFLAEGGKHAVTHVAVRESLANFALVECRLETGRTHQVRIHLGEAGAPLCGERVYDRPPNGKPLPDSSGAERPMLHAARLGFTHPESGEPMSWEVEPPADFRELLAKLRQASRS